MRVRNDDPQFRRLKDTPSLKDHTDGDAVDPAPHSPAIGTDVGL